MTCACGQEQQVPSLAGLRRLPPVVLHDEADQRPQSNPGKRWLIVLATLAVLTVACVIGGLVYLSRHHVRLAENALRSRDFAQAEFHVQKSLSLGFGGLEAHVLAARTARRQGNLEEAAQRLQSSLKWYGRDSRLGLEEQLLATQRGDFEVGEQLLEEYSTQPESPETPWVLEAYIVGSLGILMPAYARNETYSGSENSAQLERTEQAVQRWLELRTGLPDQVQGRIWRFQTRLFSHAPAEAGVQLEEALRLDPNHREARQMLAIFLTQEHPAEAAAQLQQLHDDDPSDLTTSLNLADMRRRLGQLEEAAALLDDVLARDPQNVAAIVDRGRIAYDLSDLPAAEKWFREALRLDPQSAAANLALSRCLRAAGKAEEASKVHDRYEQIQAEQKQRRDAAMSATNE